MNPADFPPGTIGLPSGDMGRYVAFTHSFAAVNKPPGTIIRVMRSLSMAMNLNTIIRNMEGDWLWILNDDHVFDEDILLRLLAREVDCVVPYYMRRYPPLEPVAYKSSTLGDDGVRSYETVPFKEVPRKGLFEVEATGTAGMLVRRYVLDAVGDPWFTWAGPDAPNEDVEFCQRIRDEDYTIHVDVDNRIGHLGVVTFVPIPDTSQETGWGFVVDFGGQPGDGLRSISVWPDRRQADESG